MSYSTCVAVLSVTIVVGSTVSSIAVVVVQWVPLNIIPHNRITRLLS